MGIRYATREALKAACNVKGVTEDANLDRALEAASRAVERLTRRIYYPLTASKTLGPFGGGDRLWLNEDLISVTSLTVDGDAVAGADIVPGPRQYGPPFGFLDFEDAVGSGDVVIVGVWGYSSTTEPAGALAEADDGSETELDVTDSSKIGIGDLILIGSERMLVTDKALLTTTATLSGNPTAVNSDETIGVSSGSLIKKGEIITVDAERMLVRDIVSNNLIVERAYDGSTLAAHSSGATVYAPRTLTVARAAAGTTAASHNSADAIIRNVPPGPIVDLVIAEAIAQREQEKSGYGRQVGQGDGATTADLRGLGQKRKQVEEDYRRRRTGAV